MKYGVLFWEQTNNIGDDIQSYAQMQFLPRVDYWIDREMIGAFESEQHEPVATIMNAWYMYNDFHWPPSNDIVPLCVSMHFSMREQSEHSYLDGLGGDYLRHNMPIGCRDEWTRALLQSKGIEGYFSGCMTLTLPNQPRQENQSPYICLVDLPPPAQRYAQKEAEKVGLQIKVCAHEVDYSGPDAPGIPQRMQAVEDLLSTYQGALCVVTTRLHCALPCLAMGVPVLLLCDEPENSRLSSFLPYLHVARTQVFCAGDSGFQIRQPPSNKPDYQSLRQSLEKRVRAFIDEAESLQEERLYIPASERAQWQARLIRFQINALGAMPKTQLKQYFKTCGFKRLLSIFAGSLVALPGSLYRAMRKRI